MREYIKEKLGDPQGVMVVDETGFLKDVKFQTKPQMALEMMKSAHAADVLLHNKRLALLLRSNTSSCHSACINPQY